MRVESEDRIEVVPARALGMVVCDACWLDPGTGKLFLLGIFASLRVSSFPFSCPKLTVYVALTGVHGRTPVKIRLVPVAEEDMLVVETEVEVASDDPLTVMDVPVELLDIVLEEPGEYRFQLWLGKGPGAYCARERRLTVEQLGERDE
jgi:hypothetical protein